MKVIIVCSGTKGILSPFIKEQMDSITRLGGIEFLLFQIKKGGWFGYLLHLAILLKAIKKFKPDLIHAHYGLSGLLANLQRGVPVITTFHGSDINDPKVLKWSKWTHRLSAASIFVEKNMILKFKKPLKNYIIPCGVDISTFHAIPKNESRKKLKMPQGSINILFSSHFYNPKKNYLLARKSCNLVEDKIGQKVNLIELKDLSRLSVNFFLNASDSVLLYSNSEGSPQFIKEAMSCNCPIVSTDVGDVRWVLGNTGGCFICSYDPNDAAEKILEALEFGEKTKGRERIIELGLDSKSIAKKIIDIYKEVSIK